MWEHAMPRRRDVLRGAALAGAAAFVASPTAAQGKARRMTAEEIQKLLDLKPHPTCGFVRVTYMSGQEIKPGGLPAPFDQGQPLGSALYFQVTPGAPVRLHRIRNDQFYHYYLGDPLEVFLLRTGGSAERVVVGPELRAGQLVQLFIPGNTFHTARLVAGGRWFLGASTEWPGVVPRDVETGDVEKLAAQYPSAASVIRAIAAVPHIK
jgi:predicted cupin superfamily sugar epimerase